MNVSRRAFLRALAAGSAAWAVGARPRFARAARGPRDALRLVFFTDVHARLEWDTPLALERAARAINGERPDLIIGGGDFITDGFESSAAFVEPRWKLVEEFIGALRAPFYPVLGNHDLVGVAPSDGSPPEADPRARFRQAFGLERATASFAAGGRHFLLLDSVEAPGLAFPYRGFIGAEQQAWLRGELERVEPGTPIVLATHLPLLTAFYQATGGGTSAAPENRIVVNAHEVLKLFEGRRLALVLQGHLHVEEQLRWRGTTFVTGGAICGKWWRGAWHGTPEGFMVVTLRGDEVSARYRAYGWTARRPADQ